MVEISLVENQAELTFAKDGVTFKKLNDLDFLAAVDVSNKNENNVSEIKEERVREQVKSLIELYKPNATKKTDIELNIILKENKIVYSRLRRLPFEEREIVENQIQEWLEANILAPSSSKYSSPVLVRRKKDGTPRVCTDYRRLNEIVVRDRFPIPVIEEQIDKLKDATIFSTLDLRNGFFHVSVNESSRKYTAIVTDSGQYEFLKTPFGFCNSPAVFQRFINNIFRQLVNEKIVLVYFDDVIVLAKNIEEALDRLKIVLNLCSEYGLEINFKKCQFMKERIEYLGQIIESGRVFPSNDKIRAVNNYPVPETLKEVQSFLGLTGYFREFIKSYAIISKPLSDLL